MFDSDIDDFEGNVDNFEGNIVHFEGNVDDFDDLYEEDYVNYEMIAIAYCQRLLTMPNAIFMITLVKVPIKLMKLIPWLIAEVYCWWQWWNY